MPRASIAETCPIQGRRRRWSVARSIEQRMTGHDGRRQILRSPLFTPVYGCLINSVGVPNSLTERTAIGSDASLHMSLGNQQIGTVYCAKRVSTRW